MEDVYNVAEVVIGDKTVIGGAACNEKPNEMV